MLVNNVIYKSVVQFQGRNKVHILHYYYAKLNLFLGVYMSIGKKWEAYSCLLPNKLLGTEFCFVNKLTNNSCALA